MDYIASIKVGAPWGIQGAFHAYPHSDQPENLLKIASFYSKTNETYVAHQVESARIHGGNHLVLKLKECSSPELARKWTNKELYVLASDLPILPTGQYYWHQLEGLEVIDQQHNHSYGVVKRCYSNGHQDILETTSGEHIPFIRDEIILKVDLDSSLISVQYYYVPSIDQEESDQD